MALRTAVASGLALTLAWGLGLAHPQWAAMTVWIAVQPTRGQLLQKSVYRVVGTVAGAVVGTLLLGGLGYQTMGMVVGLALWLGLSAALGNLHRGFPGYGFILAGYSAALVALLGGASSEPVVALGVDRALTALLGVGVAVLVTWWFTPRADVGAIEARARQVTLAIYRGLCQRLGGAPASTQQLDQWLAELAAVDSTLDAQGVGLRRARPLRALLAADTHVLLWMHESQAGDSEPGQGAGSHPGRWPKALPTDKLEGLEHLAWGPLAERCHACLAVCTDAASRRVVSELAQAMRALSGQPAPAGWVQPAATTPSVALHRDWLGAAQAGLRCVLLMLAIGSVWVATGWSAGGYALMGAAVLSTLFSSHDDPSRTMRSALVGHVLAIAAALSCRWLIWPHMDSAAGQVMAIWPFLLLGAALIAHRRTVGAGLEFNMVTLLLLQPAFPASLGLAESLMGAAGVLVGPMATALAYRWIYPTNARHRLMTLTTMMVLDLKRMARAQRAGGAVWRARLAHRTLRVAHWIGQVGTVGFSSLGVGTLIHALSEATLRARALLDERADELTPHEAQGLALFLRCMGAANTACDETVVALRQLGQHLGAAHASDARFFAHTANQLDRERAVLEHMVGSAARA